MSFETRTSFTGVLKIVPVEWSPERISRVRLIPGHTTVFSEWVDCLVPPYRTVGHSDFLSVVRDRRARQHRCQRVHRVDHVLTESRGHSFVVMVPHLKVYIFFLNIILLSTHPTRITGKGTTQYTLCSGEGKS